jgi:hypothetical protein
MQIKDDSNKLPLNKRHGYHKLFVGGASLSFKNYLKKNNYNYDIDYITDRDDLISLIDKYSHYKNYSLPVIISDISYLSKRDQSLLLKFMDDTSLNIILLASRDNILDTIISRTNEFRKFYIQDRGNRAGFINISKAREMFNNDCGASLSDDTSYEDKLLVYNKYNPLIAYDNSLVKSYRKNDQCKLLNMLEFNYE